MHKARGQGQGHKKISRPRTDPLEAKAKDQGHRRKYSPKKKKVFKNFFQAISKKRSPKFFFRRKRSSKNFFHAIFLQENKKRSTQIYCEVSGAFQQNFNGSKNSACPWAEDWAIFEDLRLRGQGQELQNLSSRTSSRPRTSSRTPPLYAIAFMKCSLLDEMVFTKQQKNIHPSL